MVTAVSIYLVFPVDHSYLQMRGVGHTIFDSHSVLQSRDETTLAIL